MVKGRVSIIIPGRCEPYFQQTIDSALERATGDIEVVAIVDGSGQEPPVWSDDNRVKIIQLDKSIGQRAAYNLGVKESSGEFVMKIDAHALLSPGYDEVLKAYCPPKTTVLPEMRRLDVRGWKDKPRGKTRFMFFGLDLYCHFWKNYRKREAAQIEYPEIMTGQGSCWFTTREWNDYIGLLDEGVGSWGNVGIEVSLRTWLCGGSQIGNRKAWQAHWFRRDDGGFTYPMDGRQVGRAHKYTRENYYFNDNAFENQERPFSWLIKKFAPVPGWEAYLVDEFKSPRVIIYYTDSKLELSLAKCVRAQIKKVTGHQIPIISVSQEPLSFGKNICVGEKPKEYRSLYEQLLVGLEAAPPGSICYLCEHDVFYHPSHFAFIPSRKTHAYFNLNRYYYRAGADSFLPARGKRALSQCVAYREMLIQHCKDRLAKWDAGKETRMRIRFFNWRSERPNVDIRHDDNLTSEGDYKRRYARGEITGVVNLPGWGRPAYFQRKSGYKGMSRGDIVQSLIDRYDYKSYLEIGTRDGKTFNRVRCDLKHGIDPAGGKATTHPVTSDKFFSGLSADVLYDIIFIDGLHEAGQVKRDLSNALAHLSLDGVIVMHDCSPRNEAEQRVPKPRKQGIWTGNVWQAFIHFRSRADLEMYVVNTNNGVGVVRRGQQAPIVIENPTYAEFDKNRMDWLNLKSTRQFKDYEEQRCTAPV